MSSSAATRSGATALGPAAAAGGLREQLAYELHDGVCQELFAIKLLLSPVLASARRIDPGLGADLESVAERVAATLESARTLALDWAGCCGSRDRELRAALEAEAEALKCDHDIDIEIDLAALAGCPIDPETIAQLRKIAREAMRNAARHGQARHISVALRDLGARWELEIGNDGATRLAQTPRCGSLGIRGMRHRAARLGGTLAIRRRVPRGLRVLVCWPKAGEQPCSSRAPP